MLAVIIRAPVEALDIEREPAVALGADGQYLKPGLDHLGPDAVAAQRGDLVCAHDPHPVRFAHPPLPLAGEGTAAATLQPLARLREREGPAAKPWEGEGTTPLRRVAAPGAA